MKGDTLRWLLSWDARIQCLLFMFYFSFFTPEREGCKVELWEGPASYRFNHRVTPGEMATAVVSIVDRCRANVIDDDHSTINGITDDTSEQAEFMAGTPLDLFNACMFQVGFKQISPPLKNIKGMNADLL